MGNKLRFVADWLKIYTTYLTFMMFVVIIQQTELRQYIASVCPDYEQAKPQFTHYSNGEPYYG